MRWLSESLWHDPRVKIFVSWSKETSHKVALALREWLPQVIQQVEPWVSSEDIAKGDRGGTAIARELAGTDQGVICLTKANVREPWLNFEAGALSKHAGDETRVRSVLFDLKATDVTGPLSDFQHTNLNDKGEVLKLVESINKSCEPSLKDTVLARSFEKNWPDLVEALEEIRQSTPPETPASRTVVVPKDDPSNDAAEDRDIRQIAEETLERVRAIEREQRRLRMNMQNVLRARRPEPPRESARESSKPPPFAVISGVGLARVRNVFDNGTIEFELTTDDRVLIEGSAIPENVVFFDTSNEARRYMQRELGARGDRLDIDYPEEISGPE